MVNKIINRLRAFMGELEQEAATSSQSVKAQATNKLDSNEKDCEKKLFSLFPVFNKHSEFLKLKGYYCVNDDKLVWKHGGNLLLAGYFGMIQDIPGNTRFMWADIERAFNTRN